MAAPTYSAINGAGTGSIIPSGAPATTLAKPPAPAPAPATAPTNPQIAADGLNQGQINALAATQPQQTATSTVTPPLQPQTDDQVYADMLTQSQSQIDAINAATQAQIASANQTIDTNAAQAQQGQNALAAITGGFGSSSVSGAQQVSNTASQQKTTQDQAIQAQGAQQLATLYNNLQTAATSQANYEQSTAFSQGQTYQTYLLGQAQNTLTGMAKQGVTLQTLQTEAQNGNAAAQTTLQNLLNAYGGDSNALSAAAALATPAPTVTSSWADGTSYYQLVTNPLTGQPSVQSFQFPVPVPQGATVQKLSTTGSVMTFPDGSSAIVSTDPGTGQITVQGTGGTSGASSDASNWANSVNAAQNTGTPSSSSSTPSTTSNVGDSGYTNTFLSTLSDATGTTFDASSLSTPLSQVLSTSGVANLASASAAAEGGSEAGVQNNPYNIKYVAGMANATQGPAATDGGYFANFATPQDATAAYNDLVTSAASGTNKNYGPNPTLGSFLNTYANLSSNGSGAGSQYGLLTSNNTNSALQSQGMTPFNPQGTGTVSINGTNYKQSQIDGEAANFITNYLSTGTVPSTSGMGGAATLDLKNAIQQRAEDVYYAATGQELMSPTVQNNIQMIQGNESLLNTLGVNAPTIAANANLLIDKINAGNINKNAPAINAIIDPIIQALGNVPVAALNAQTSTLGNELGSLLALKNAGGSGGSTVHDKLMAADLITPDSTAAQEADVVNTILQEAVNAQGKIANQTLNLYQQTDPANLMGGNPMNNPDYGTLSGAGFTWMGGSTYQSSSGAMFNVSAQGQVTPVQTTSVTDTSTQTQ